MREERREGGREGGREGREGREGGREAEEAVLINHRVNTYSMHTAVKLAAKAPQAPHDWHSLTSYITLH